MSERLEFVKRLRDGDSKQGIFQDALESFTWSEWNRIANRCPEEDWTERLYAIANLVEELRIRA
jgi:hypothetical protein